MRSIGLGQAIEKRSFSFMLAKRYLNPRRAILSSFTLISLIGVMLGVLVLVVVMAVYAGMEREVKGRLLGFTPHILVKTPYMMEGQNGETETWRDLLAKGMKLQGVAGATAYVADNVIVDVGTWQRPVSFRGIDTSDASQVKGVEDMLDKETYPESSADMGIDDRVVISSLVAEQFLLKVGDKLRLYSTRNFEEVMQAYKATENPVVREQYADQWALGRKIIDGKWPKEAEIYLVPENVMVDGFNALTFVYEQKYLREPEREMIDDILGEMSKFERDTERKVFLVNEEGWQELQNSFAALGETDAEKMDGEILKGLKNVVLPKEAEVIGVYAASQMAAMPEIFMPLHLAQSLAGLDDQVQGIALRLDDAYMAEKIVVEAGQALGNRYELQTWGEQFRPFFILINQQRIMMYFALSFIVLVSAFSMMAVMFTVTIQKRREIGVMKALGAAPGQIVCVFLYQGMLLGLLGALLGIGLGRVVIYFRGTVQEVMRALGFDPFSAQFTGFKVLPAYNDSVEQLVIGFMAFVLCSIAALVPAFFAARSDAAKSLRNL